MHFYRQSRPSRPQNPGQQILLEREGTMWEGRDRKELPAWMTEPEEVGYKRLSTREHTVGRIGQLLASILGIKS